MLVSLCLWRRGLRCSGLMVGAFCRCVLLLASCFNSVSISEDDRRLSGENRNGMLMEMKVYLFVYFEICSEISFRDMEVVFGF